MRTIVILAALALCFTSCNKEQIEHGTPHAIITTVDVTENSATLTITSNVYSTAPMKNWGLKFGAEDPYNWPKLDDDAHVTGNSVTFTHTLYDLDTNTTYFCTVYCYLEAHNKFYSEDTIRFTTKAGPESLIGTTGPGGGLIFYQDGQGGGMEMSTSPYTGAWVDDMDVPFTVPDFGGGDYNTSLIVNSTSISYSAPQKCYDLIQGGYDDWFLPSQEELNLIYENLVQKGHFNPLVGSYITSTQSPNLTNYCVRLDLITGTVGVTYKSVNAHYVAVRTF